MARGRGHSTYSIVACDLEAAEWGSRCSRSSSRSAPGVPAAEPQVGAIATQALANMRYGPDGLALLREGLSAEEVVARLTKADEGREHRQLGVVDAQGRAATYTGESASTGRAASSATAMRPGQHPRLGGDGHGARARPSRRPRGSRSPSGCSRHSAPRRPPEAIAVGNSRPRCSSSARTAATWGRRTRCRPAGGRPPHTDRGAPPDLRHARPPLRRDAPREEWLEVDEQLAQRSCGNG